jgi:CBS domain-containing protein
MENIIPLRIADFLKDYPPFQALDTATLRQMAESVTVRYCPKGEIIFRQGEQPLNQVYVVREGAINLYHDEDLVDQCDEGELFGLRPLLAKDAYALQAITHEESLLYVIPADFFKEAASNFPEVWKYIAANFASGWQYKSQAHDKTNQSPTNPSSFQLLEIQSIERSKVPVTASPNMSINEAALRMSHHGVGSLILVNDQQYPLGIITDKDLRNQVATGLVPLQTPVHQIMSSPVITAAAGISVADVQLLMVNHSIHHICLTTDGSDQSPVIGIITEHDLLIVQSNNPAAFVREIKRAKHPEALRDIRNRAEHLLRQYIEQEVAIAYIAPVMSAINDAIIQRCISLAQEQLAQVGLQPPPNAFCWLTLGSEGRQEQLLRTDQDSALLYEDIPGTDPKPYFLRLASITTGYLNTCGFEYCPADMMASNPQWCLSLSEWKNQFRQWLLEPDPKSVMLCTIFFDYRPVFGQHKLATELTNFIYTILKEEKIFLAFLAKNALENPPPLTFFRDIMVEKSGEHQHEFDIKARALMPLTDAARVLTLFHAISGINNTIQRFLALAAHEPQNAEIYQQGAEAYEILLRFRTRQGLRHQDSGRFFQPNQLSKMDRIILRNSFRPIQELQSLLKTRFQLHVF